MTPMRGRRVEGVVLLLAMALLSGMVVADIPECNTDIWQCHYYVSPTFAQAIRMKFDGQWGELKADPKLHDAYCDPEMWKTRSEICGGCPIKLTLSSPSSLTKDVICLRDNAFAPYSLNQHMDLKHALNGKELEIVAPENDGCDAADWATKNFAGKMAIVNNRLRTCTYNQQFAHAAAAGAVIGLMSSSRGKHYVWNWHVSKMTGDGKAFPNMLAYALESFHGDQIFAATSTVRGKVEYSCSVYSNRETDMSLNYDDDDCPWWFLQGTTMCDKEFTGRRRMCTRCPLEIDVGDPTFKPCVWGPDFNPARKENYLTGTLSLPSTQNVVYLSRSYMTDDGCSDASWAGLAGKLVAFQPERWGGPCSHYESVMRAQRAGVSGVIVVVKPNHWHLTRLQGTQQNIKIPIGTISPKHSERWMNWMMQGTALPNGRGWERANPMAKGVLIPHEVTPAPPMKVELVEPIPEEDTDEVTSEAGFVVSVILIPLLLIVLCVHFGLTRQSGLSGPGVPLEVMSTTLSVVLLVVLALATFALMNKAGQDSLDTSKANADNASMYASARNKGNVDSMAAQVMGQMVQVALSTLHAFLIEGRDKGDMIQAFFQTDHDGTFATFVQHRNRVAKIQRAQYLSHYFDEGWTYHIVTKQGFFMDSLRVNDYRVQDALGRTIFDTNSADNFGIMQNAIEGNGAAVDDTGPNVPKALWNPLHWAFSNKLPTDAFTWYAAEAAAGRPRAVTNPVQSYTYSRFLPSPVMTTYFTFSKATAGDQTTDGIVFCSRGLAELSRKLKSNLGTWERSVKFGENATLVVLDQTTGNIIASNDVSNTFYTSEVYGEIFGPTSAERDEALQFGFKLETVDTTSLIPLNAIANKWRTEHGGLALRGASSFETGPALFTFDQKDYYDTHGNSRTLLLVNFEGGIKDASKENWDVVGAGVQTTSDGDFKQVGVFSGSAPVLVHTYLTTRVARVAQQESQEYKLSAPHPVPGVSGSAVYTLRNSSDLTQKTWVHRDPFFRYHDYTLSVFIRPDVDMNEGDSSPTSPRIFSDTQIGDSAIRWYANGELRIALLRYGCWAKPIKGGLRGGQWVHLAAVVNFVAKTCVVYMNGVPMSSGEMPGLVETMFLPYTGEPMQIGLHYKGWMDEFQVVRKALAQEDVLQLYNNGKPGGDPIFVESRTWMANFDTLDVTTVRLGSYLVGALVPVSDITREVDKATARSNMILSIQNENIDKELERKLAVTVLVVVVICLVAVLLFMVFNNLITKPFEQTALLMAEAAVMNIDTMPKTKSFVRELQTMNQAMVLLLSNLQMYKKFLPSSLFEEKEQDIVRNSRPPPGITSGTATLVFTDIRSSTSIWEAVPQGMCEALKIHNRIIRAAMDEFEGYEVKTIGDAFMVAFATVLDGVNFGLRVHEALRNATWPAELLHFKLCADTSPLWGGLTVRIGVNAGPVTVEKNTLTGRTDYFGHTVNVASRLESTCKPGAVGLRHEVWQEECSGVCSATVGEVHRIELKGVSGKTPVCCVWPTSLAGRVTNPLMERRLSAGSVHTTASSAVSSRSSVSTISLPGSVSTSGRLATVGIVQVAVGDEAHVSAMRTMSTHLITLKSCLDRSGGRMVSVIGSLVCIAWNLSHAAPAHVENSLRFVQYLYGTSSVRVGGLMTGTVHQGDVSANTLRFVTVLGDAVQKCWRLCEEAKREEVFFLYEPPVDTVLPQNLERALTPHRTGVYVVQQKRDKSQLDSVMDT